MPDRRVRICSAPHGCDPPLRTPLRGLGLGGKTLIQSRFETGLIYFSNPNPRPIEWQGALDIEDAGWACGRLGVLFFIFKGRLKIFILVSYGPLIHELAYTLLPSDQFEMSYVRVQHTIQRIIPRSEFF